MRPHRARTPLIAAALAVLAAAVVTSCARGIAVEPEPGPRYALEVSNPMPHPMIVAYDDGTGERLLGTVPAGGREHFIVVDPAEPTVTIVGFDRERTHTVRRRVTLRADGTVSVSLSS